MSKYFPMTNKHFPDFTPKTIPHKIFHYGFIMPIATIMLAVCTVMLACCAFVILAGVAYMWGIVG